MDPPDRSTPQTGTPVILLSVFDGIGCSKLALDMVLDHTQCYLLGYLAWEIDQDCINLTSQAHQVHHRGDFMQDDLNEIVQQITAWDPEERAILLFCAGPPCPDYSRITEGPGRDGTEGIKFEHYAKWQKQLVALIGQRRAAKLTENVIPHRRGDIQYFETTKLGQQAIIFDAAEFKRISRPRVWWSNIDWDDPTVTKVLGQNLTWKKHFGTHKVCCPQPISEAHIPDGWTAPECWAQGDILPCLTTPAPTDSGRAAPRSSKGKMDSATYGRWVADNRQYAPWHYHETATTSSTSRPSRPRSPCTTSQWATQAACLGNSDTRQSQTAGTSEWRAC